MQETAEQYIARILGYVEGQDAIKVQKDNRRKVEEGDLRFDGGPTEMASAAGQVVDR